MGSHLFTARSGLNLGIRMRKTYIFLQQQRYKFLLSMLTVFVRIFLSASFLLFRRIECFSIVHKSDIGTLLYFFCILYTSNVGMELELEEPIFEV
jgi:hypothetical protein